MRESKNFVEYRRSGYGQIRDRDPWFKEEITGKVRFNPTEGPKYTIGVHISNWVWMKLTKRVIEVMVRRWMATRRLFRRLSGEV